MQTFELREQNSIEEIPLLDLPIKHTGTMESCQNYAFQNGYIFVRSKNYIFGGYFANPKSGNCLFLT